MKQAVESKTMDVARQPRATKKEQIVDLFKAGTTDVRQIAELAGASMSYVSSVLQENGLMTGYFDLYTTTANPMNVYSKLFVNKLGFRNEETARRSVRELDRAYKHFDERRDRAGQHHALEMALVMFNRARWTGKAREAEIFRQWLVSRLDLSLPDAAHNAELPLFINREADELIS